MSVARAAPPAWRDKKKWKATGFRTFSTNTNFKRESENKRLRVTKMKNFKTKRLMPLMNFKEHIYLLCKTVSMQNSKVN